MQRQLRQNRVISSRRTPTNFFARGLGGIAESHRDMRALLRAFYKSAKVRGEEGVSSQRMIKLPACSSPIWTFVRVMLS
jgi:hypothetical protein